MNKIKQGWNNKNTYQDRVLITSKICSRCRVFLWIKVHHPHSKTTHTPKLPSPHLTVIKPLKFLAGRIVLSMANDVLWAHVDTVPVTEDSTLYCADDFFQSSNAQEWTKFAIKID